MPQTLMDFLAGPVMTELASTLTVQRGHKRYLPAELYKKTPSGVVGDKVQFDRFIGEQNSALVTAFNSTPKSINTPDGDKAFGTAIGSRESYGLDTDMVMSLKSDIPYIQDRAKRLLVNKIANFKSRMETLQTYAVNSLLCNQGQIWYDTTGKILPSSSGAYMTVSQGFVSGNALTKTSGLISPAVVGDWSQASTDIGASIRNIKQYAISQGQKEPNNILYGQNINTYISNTNSSAAAYLSRNPVMGQQYMNTGEIPQGLFDCKWYPAWKEMYIHRDRVTNTVTTQAWMPAKQIVMFPDLTEEEYEFFEAGALVPNGIGAHTTDIDGALALSQVVHGYFSFCESFSWSPPQATITNGWFGLPIWKNPLAIWTITVA